jgi:hypothetical protein
MSGPKPPALSASSTTDCINWSSSTTKTGRASNTSACLLQSRLPIGDLAAKPCGPAHDDFLEGLINCCFRLAGLLRLVPDFVNFAIRTRSCLRPRLLSFLGAISHSTQRTTPCRGSNDIQLKDRKRIRFAPWLSSRSMGVCICPAATIRTSTLAERAKAWWLWDRA